MTTIDALVAMSGGNPGALSVLMQLMKRGGEVDPDALLGGLAHVMDLDMFRIYADKIWILYKDICGQDIVRTIGVIRAMQLGIAPGATIQAALEEANVTRKSSLDVEAILAKVRERLPRFGVVAS